MNKLSAIQEYRDKPSKVNSNNQPRQCMHDDCKVRLSRYNLTSYCAIHEHIYYKLSKDI